MKIAVIAPGAMGAAVARRLHANGADVAVCLAGRSDASARRAEKLPTRETEAALGEWADVVLSILPPGEAMGLADRLAPVLRGRGADVIFADCNAVSPATVLAIAARLAGTRFVDVGIIGGPPGMNGPGPKLYASGEYAGSLSALREHGVDLRVIEGGIGAASALKMSYAGITKGLTALGSAMALGASDVGAATALRAELADSQPDLLRYLDRSVPDMFVKAYRWVAEMEEIADFLGERPSAAMYRGMARHYEAIAADVSHPQESGPVATLANSYRKGS